MIRLGLVDGLVAILLLLLLLLIVIVEGNSIPKGALQTATTGSSSSSPWLNKLANPRPTGCRKRPWICREGQCPPTVRMRCCRNQCVDVASDVNNCGMCRRRCPFTRQCCGGKCVNTNRNPSHCGRCFNICPWKERCFYGMCGYAEPFPPRPWPCPPFPFPPKPPKPHPPQPPDPPRGDHPPAMS